jgi:hypothetical protein
MIAALAMPTAGCGSSDSGDGGSTEPQAREAPQEGGPAGIKAKSCPADFPLSATAVGCAEAHAVAAEWSDTPACRTPPDASRFACTVDGFRCLGAAVGRGIAVSCAMPQRSISFVAEPR